MQQSAIECQQAGVDAKVSNLYHAGQRSVIIVLAGCELVNGNIVLANSTRDAGILAREHPAGMEASSNRGVKQEPISLQQ